MNKPALAFSTLTILLTAPLASIAQTDTGAHRFLQPCLPLSVVNLLTGLSLTQSSEDGNPQNSCSYSNSEQLSKQSRVSYARDSGYRVAFGESDIMQKVTGLGNFAEFDLEGGQLYVNIGSDGLMFEGRQGKQKLSLEKLRALAEKVLQKP